MINTIRTMQSLITLTCVLLFGLSLSAQAQGLKTNSGSFGSGWQVGGAGSVDTSSGYSSAGSGAGSGAGSAGSPGSPTSTYGGYTGSSSGAGSPGNATGSNGSYNSTYGNAYGGAAPPETNTLPSSRTENPYSAPRSAGGGLRTQ